jgi:hypothetical protein
LLSFDPPNVSLPNEVEFTGFQSASQVPPFSGFQGAPQFTGFQATSTPQTSFSQFQSASPAPPPGFSGFQGANNQNTGDPFESVGNQVVPKYDSESAFFSGSTSQTAKPSKQSILQLYNSPASATNSPLPVSFNQPISTGPPKPNGPNYNVVLPGIGMPAVPTVPLGLNPIMNGNSMGSNFYNQGGPNFVGYQVRSTSANFVNTNGYVNPNYQAQQTKFM